MISINRPAIENAKPPVKGRRMVWDSVISDDAALSGSFGFRVTERGVKSWVTMYRLEDKRNPGKKIQRFQTLGHFPATPLAEARELARDALKLVGQGFDPIEEAKREKIETASIKSVGEAVKAFIERHSKRQNRSWKQTDRAFEVYVLPKWKDKSLVSITPADVHEVLDGIMDAGYPFMANRVFDDVRKFFNWCKERSWITIAPTEAIKRPAKKVARDRVLDKGEIVKVWQGCDALGWPFGSAFKLLLLTGQRRNEVARMKWEHLNPETGVWTLPQQDTKSNRQHDVPLSLMVMEILERLPKNGDYVFSTTGKTPISGFSRVKKRLDKLSDTQGWRLHDLRRTAASRMAEIGIAPHVIEKVLNHSTGQISGVAAVYNRHTYLREKTDALNAWAKALEAIVRPSDAGNVVEMNELQRKMMKE